MTFRVVGGSTPLKSFAGGSWMTWDEDGPQFNGMGYFRNGFPVLRHVLSLTTEWIRREKPFRFHFDAIDHRRHRIYRYMLARYRGPIMSHYVHYMDADRFWFVRTVP